MPQAVAFVGGMFGVGAGTAFAGATFGSWVAGAAFAGTAIGGVVAKLVTGVALSALSRALMPKPRIDIPGLRTEQTLTGGRNPDSFILGEFATAGVLVAPMMSHGQAGKTPNAYLTYVIELAGRPGHQLEGLMLNGEPVPILETSPHPDYGKRLGGRFTDYAWIKYYDGTQTVADPMLMSKYIPPYARPWTSDMVGHGICYAIVTCQYEREVFQQFPGVKFVLSGMPLYDPRKDSTAGGSGAQRWSNPTTWAATKNPAVMIYNILRGIEVGGDVWGGGIPAEDLPFAVWAAAMDACDASVNITGGSEAAFEAGFEVRVDDEPYQVIEELSKSCGAMLAERGGVWTIRVGGPGLPVLTITDDDLMADSPDQFRPFPPIAEIYNAITASWTDPDSLWEAREADPLYNTAWEAEDGNRRLTTSVAFPAVTRGTQVERLASAMIADHRRMRVHTISLPPMAEGLMPLDVISWTSDYNGYVAKTFEVVRIDRQLLTGRVGVVLREIEAGDWIAPVVTRPSVPTEDQTKPVIPAPQGVPGWHVEPWTVRDGANVARRPALRCTWDPDAADDARGIKIAIRKQGEAGPGEVVIVTDVRAGEYIHLGVIPDQAYQMRARILVDRATEWSAWVTATAPDVRLGWDELDQAAQEKIDAFDEWIGEDFPIYSGEVEQAIADLEQLATDNLGTAKDYTDTSIQAEQLARVAGDQALATQIQTLTAVLNSENYIVNPLFTDGKIGWIGSGSGPAVVLDQDDQSPDPIVSEAPTPKFASLDPLTTIQTFYQVFDIADWQDGERLQWRLRLGSNEALPVRVQTTLRRADNSNIAGTADIQTITLVPGEWRTYSRQRDIHPDTERVAFIIYLDGSAYGEPLGIADVSVTRVDVSAISRITDLEVVVANNESALGLWQQQVESHLDTIDGDVSANATAISNRYTKAETNSAISSATTSLQSTLVNGPIKDAQDDATAALNALPGKLDASVIGDYYTKVETGTAISQATTNLKSSMESPGGSVYAAQQAAQDASNLAGGKGEVIYGSSTPPVAKRQSQNLWIDTSGGNNTPKRWNGSNWVAVTDKVATDAAAAAQAALSALTTKLDASVIENYYTKVEADSAIAGVQTIVEASKTQENLVLDGTFALGFEEWPQGYPSRNFSFLARNLSSGTYVTNTMPAPRAFVLTPANQVAGQWIGTPYRSVTVGEEILISMDYARNVSTGVVPRLVCRFRDKDGNNIPGTQISVPGNSGGKWNTISARGVVPAGAVEAQVYLIGATTGSPTTNAWITNVSAMRGAEAFASGRLQITTETADGEAVARIGLQARVDGASPSQAALFLEALSGGGSTILARADSLFLIDDTTEEAPFAYVGGELYANARLTARWLDVDELLTIQGGGALAAFKQSPDDETDGLFFGQVQEGAQTKFALSASRTASGGVPQEVRFGSDGFKLTNAQFYYNKATPDPVVRRTTDLAVTTLQNSDSPPKRAQMVRIPSAIGGGGGGGTYTNAGSAGGDTVIELYDGSTLKMTITANGGAGGATDLWPNTRPGERGIDPGNRGGGGDSGFARDLDGKRQYGRGGKAGRGVSRDWIDVSSWTTPRIKITIGSAGAGGAGSGAGNGAPGIAGMASYQILTESEVRSGTVPLAPTASGSFPKAANTPGSFPDLGPGYWSITVNGGQQANLGTVNFGGGITQGVNVATTFGFFASQTPTYSGGPDARTISYLFHDMDAPQ